MGIDLSKYPLIWCSICEDTQPVEVAEMKADHLNDHDAADLLCSKCKFIVATVHAK